MLDQRDEEYLAYLRENGASPQEIQRATADALLSKGLQGDDLQAELEYIQYKNTGATPTPWDVSPLNPKVFMEPVHALDYGSNVGRGAVAMGAQALGAPNMGVDFETIKNNDVPQTSELMRRAGVPEMDLAKSIAMQSGLTEKQAAETTEFIPSGRTLGGFAGDVALDPTTWFPALKASKVGKWAKAGVDKLPKNFANLIKGAGTVAGEGITSGMRTGGKNMYVSGLKELDQATDAVGQLPVSEVLWKHGVTGSAKDIRQKSLALAKDLRAKSKGMLSDAKKAGAEVDMNLAMQDAQKFVNDLKKMEHPNPAVQRSIEMLQMDIDRMRGAGARTVTKELPFTVEMRHETYTPQAENVHKWYDAPTEGVSYDVSNARPGQGPQVRNVAPTDANNVYAPENPFPWVKTGAPEGERELTNIINNAKDKVKKSSLPVGGKYGKELEIVPVSMPYDEVIPGPNPEQVAAWKTMDQAAVGTGWDELARTNMGQGYTKAKAAGERKAVEQSMNVLGPNAPTELHTTNDELGRLLTSRKAARNMSKKEANKNSFTSVDGMLWPSAAAAAVHYGSPLPFVVPVVKKGADISKTTGFRTRGGKLLNKMGTQSEVISPEGFWRQLLLTPTDRDEIP